MKKIGMIVSVLALCGGTAFSQSQLDAYNYAKRDLSGTARYLSMGGAFGALGGDVSAIHTNPAGLAIYRSSEIVTTLSLSSVSANTDWLGSKVDDNRMRFNFDNIAYVGYFPTANDEGIMSWNVGFSYNRLKNFSRNYTTMTGGGLHTSLSDYIASRAYGVPSDWFLSGENYNPYDNGDIGDWLSILGYDAGYIDAYNDNKSEYYSAFGDYNTNGEWEPYALQGGQLKVSERGSVDQYDLAFGMNISDILFLGASVAITDLSYSYESTYDEEFVNGNYLYLDNYLETDGTGYSLNVGAIVRPSDYFRLGVAYNSPTWFKMTDRYQGWAGSYLTFMDAQSGALKERAIDTRTPDYAYYDYEYRTPDKWIFSAAAILGTTALISVDYELTNYQKMRMYNTDGSSNAFTNQDITNNFKIGNTIRAGAEVKVTPQFAVRAGVAYSDSPLKDPLKEGLIDVATVGTIPHYTIDKGVMHYTVGLGYRFTPSFYMDLACVFRSQKEDVYNFSNMHAENDPLPIIEAQPASLKTKTTRVALTLGYKF